MSKIWEAVRALGALDPLKLARFTDANLNLIAKSACSSCGEANKLDETREWLKELRAEASTKPEADSNRMIEEWRQRCYLYSARQQEARQKEVVPKPRQHMTRGGHMPATPHRQR